MEILISENKLRLIEGNIVLQAADAIVNAANKSLILGGGVAGAIRQYGGPSIQEECNRIGPIETGDAVLTGAGELKAKYVIHAAGPVYGEGNEDSKLTKVTLNCLKLAQKNQLESIVFPAVSTGIFRFPMQKCSEIMLHTAYDFLTDNELPKEVTFCLFGKMAFNLFSQTLKQLQQELPESVI